MSLYEKKARTFWHETGHFVASWYNAKHYGKPGTESIVIKRGINGKTMEPDYSGQHNYMVPSGNLGSSIIEHPASKIASLTYGCIFQCIYTQQPFTTCFNTLELSENGFNDFNGVIVIARRFELNAQELEELLSIIVEEYEAIKDKPEFKELFLNNIEEYIGADIDHLPINLDKLGKLVSTFLSQHEFSYKKFVNKLEVIFLNRRCLTSAQYALKIANEQKYTNL